MVIQTEHPSIVRVQSLPPREPGGNYVMFRQVGSLLYVAGQTSTQTGRDPIVGQIGKDLSVGQG